MDRVLTRKDIKALGISDYVRDELIVKLEQVTVNQDGPYNSYRYSLNDLMNSVLFRFYLILNCRQLRVTENNDNLSDKRIEKMYRPYRDADRYWFKLLTKPVLSDDQAEHFQYKIDQLNKKLQLIAKIYQHENVIDTWDKFSSGEGQLFTVNGRFVDNDFARFYATPLNQELADLMGTLANNKLEAKASLWDGLDFKVTDFVDRSLVTELSDVDKDVLERLQDFLVKNLKKFKAAYLRVTGLICPLTKDNLRNFNYEDLHGKPTLSLRPKNDEEIDGTELDDGLAINEDDQGLKLPDSDSDLDLADNLGFGDQTSDDSETSELFADDALDMDSADDQVDGSLDVSDVDGSIGDASNSDVNKINTVDLSPNLDALDDSIDDVDKINTKNLGDEHKYE